MTCRDCIHYEVCQYHIDEETKMTINECGRFKNKADFVEVKHSKWIWLEGILYECYECGAKTEVDEKMNQPLYQYCPYCGAKMDGERKEQ